MKQLLITIAALVLVGCGESQSPEPPDISIYDAATDGNIEAVKQHLADGADVNAKNDGGETPLDSAIQRNKNEIANLLPKHGAKPSDISIHRALAEGDIEAVKRHLNAGTDVNEKEKNATINWRKGTS